MRAFSYELNEIRYKKHRAIDFLKHHSERLQERIEIMKEFGSKCVVCGCDDIDVLEFDHKNNDGWKEKSMRGVIDVRRHGNLTKDKYQLLCANCHRKKTKYFSSIQAFIKHNIPLF